MKLRVTGGGRDEEPKTLLARFGFQDRDLTSPKHDEMMLWLDEHVGEVIEEITPTRTPTAKEMAALAAAIAAAYRKKIEQTQQEIEGKESLIRYAARQEADYRQKATVGPPPTRPPLRRPGEVSFSDPWVTKPETYLEWAASQQEQRKRAEAELAVLRGRLEELHKKAAGFGRGEISPPPPCPRTAVTDRRWEQPVMDRKYTIGFVDMVVTYTAHRLEWTWADEMTTVWRWVKETRTVGIEVKSAIPSLGEVIRQIRVYQEHVEYPFHVLCPDDRFAEPLRGQGIGFLTYAPGGAERAPAWVEQLLDEEDDEAAS